MIIEKVVKVVSGRTVTCDCCKKTFSEDNGIADEIALQEFLHYSDIGGYGSVIGDGARKEIDLCESCVKKLLGEWLRVVDLRYF